MDYYLFVGLGGTGGNILINLKKKMNEYDKCLKKKTNDSFYLYLDADKNIVESDSNKDQDNRPIIEDDEICNIGITTNSKETFNSLKREYEKIRYYGIEKIFSEEKRKKFKLTFTEGVGQWRSNGRFCILGKSQKVFNSLKSIINEMKKEFQKLYIYVFSSICGGAGSGFLFDFIAILQLVLKNNDINNKDIRVILHGPEIYNALPNTANVLPNAVGTLMELNHIMKNNRELNDKDFELPFPYLIKDEKQKDRTHLQIDKGFKVFEETSFRYISAKVMGNSVLQIQNPLDLAEIAAEAIFQEVRVVGHDLNPVLVNPEEVEISEKGNSNFLSSMSAARINFPLDEIVEIAQLRAFAKLISRVYLKANSNQEKDISLELDKETERAKNIKKAFVEKIYKTIAPDWQATDMEGGQSIKWVSTQNGFINQAIRRRRSFDEQKIQSKEGITAHFPKFEKDLGGQIVQNPKIKIENMKKGIENWLNKTTETFDTISKQLDDNARTVVKSFEEQLWKNLQELYSGKYSKDAQYSGLHLCKTIIDGLARELSNYLQKYKKENKLHSLKEIRDKWNNIIKEKVGGIKTKLSTIGWIERLMGRTKNIKWRKQAIYEPCLEKLGGKGGIYAKHVDLLVEQQSVKVLKSFIEVVNTFQKNINNLYDNILKLKNEAREDAIRREHNLWSHSWMSDNYRNHLMHLVIIDKEYYEKFKKHIIYGEWLTQEFYNKLKKSFLRREENEKSNSGELKFLLNNGLQEDSRNFMQNLVNEKIKDKIKDKKEDELFKKAFKEILSPVVEDNNLLNDKEKNARIKIRDNFINKLIKIKDTSKPYINPDSVRIGTRNILKQEHIYISVPDCDFIEQFKEYIRKTENENINIKGIKGSKGIFIYSMHATFGIEVMTDFPSWENVYNNRSKSEPNEVFHIFSQDTVKKFKLISEDFLNKETIENFFIEGLFNQFIRCSDKDLRKFIKFYIYFNDENQNPLEKRVKREKYYLVFYDRNNKEKKLSLFKEDNKTFTPLTALGFFGEKCCMGDAVPDIVSSRKKTQEAIKRKVGDEGYLKYEKSFCDEFMKNRCKLNNSEIDNGLKSLLNKYKKSKEIF